MLLLICDVETTGLENSDTTVELAWVVYDTETKQTLTSNSFMYPHEEIPTEKLIKITPELSKVFGKDAIDLNMKILEIHLNKCDAIVAHNAKFDKRFVEKLPDCPTVLTKPWVCSYEDLDFGTKATKLTYMCTDFGVPVSGAHRAINDVLMLAQLLSKLPNLEEQVTSILTKKKFTVQAVVSFNDKELAKEAGFKWEADRKAWVKSVRAENKEAINGMFNFTVRILD